MAPTAKFSWRMAPRAKRWVEVWNKKGIAYDPNYVTPKRWEILLDASGSIPSGSPIVSERWDIRGLDNPAFKTSRADHRTTDGPLTVSVTTLGRYLITLTVTDQAGQISEPVSREILARDIVIASIGDSAASGEGNPDKGGNLFLDKILDASLVLDPFTDDPEPEWTDRRCHRSRYSGHAMAAALIEEKEPTSSVTFISFACSGAKITSGLTEPYEGMEPLVIPGLGIQKFPDLPPQIQALAQTLGQRDIDLLLITAGINNIGIGDSGFSSVIKALVNPVTNDQAFKAVEDHLRTVANLYDTLAFALSRALHSRVSEVYITEYPANIFQDESVAEAAAETSPFAAAGGGCGALSAITPTAGAFLTRKGVEFSRIIAASATRHGWHFVSGISEAFNGHGYCDLAESWFVHVSESVINQFNVDGSAHPNRAGHRAIARRIVQTIQQGNKIRPVPRHVTVTFDKLTLADDAFPGGVIAPISPQVIIRVNGEEHILTLPLTRRSTLSIHQVRFSCFVNNGLCGIVRISADVRLPPLRPLDDPQPTPDVQDRPQARNLRILDVFGLNQQFGAGTHVRRDDVPQGFLQISYRVDVEFSSGPIWLEAVLNSMMR